MLKIPRIGAVVSIVFAMPVVLAFPANAASLTPHLAKYDLTLQGATQAADIASVSGLLVLEFKGAACTGYTNDVRIVTAIDSQDGDRMITDIRARTIESPDGRLEFFNETYSNGQRVEYSVGSAERASDGISVELVEPVEHQLVLDAGLIYPTEHMLTILTAAREGKPFVAADVYDGSQDGELIYQTATVIGPEKTDQRGDEVDDLMAQNGFTDVPYWPVIISYFEKSDDLSDSTPDFVVSYLLYENGIGRQFVIDYGEFSLRGRLSNLDILPAVDC